MEKFDSFHHYWQQRRPLLQAALEEQVSPLLVGLPEAAVGGFRRAFLGGKGLRGILLSMIAEILGQEWEAALPRAVAVEMIQAATLAHDDFVDQDRTRRGAPAVWTLMGARRAVLLGDVLFATAIRMMNEIGREDGGVVSRAIADIARGALLEPWDPGRLTAAAASAPWREGLYDRVIHLKTGVLFEAACELGAISALRDGGVRERCRRYGSCIGEAYQMADDVQEIRWHLRTGRIHAREMVQIAPAVLCFAPGAQPHLAPVLSGATSAMTAPMDRLFRSAAQHMEAAIRQRLVQAAEAMADVLDGIRHGALCLEAPHILLALFNRSQPQSQEDLQEFLAEKTGSEG